MRILTVSEMWDKLKQDTFTTFRFARKDSDWKKGERVKVVYKSRSPKRKELGTAEIIGKVSRRILEDVTGTEAKEDGFQSISDMAIWLRKRYGDRIEKEPMNRLMLKWIEKNEDVRGVRK